MVAGLVAARATPRAPARPRRRRPARRALRSARGRASADTPAPRRRRGPSRSSAGTCGPARADCRPRASPGPVDACPGLFHQQVERRDRLGADRYGDDGHGAGEVIAERQLLLAGADRRRHDQRVLPAGDRVGGHDRSRRPRDRRSRAGAASSTRPRGCRAPPARRCPRSAEHEVEDLAPAVLARARDDHMSRGQVERRGARGVVHQERRGRYRRRPGRPGAAARSTRCRGSARSGGRWSRCRTRSGSGSGPPDPDSAESSGPCRSVPTRCSTTRTPGIADGVAPPRAARRAPRGGLREEACPARTGPRAGRAPRAPPAGLHGLNLPKS